MCVCVCVCVCVREVSCLALLPSVNHLQLPVDLKIVLKHLGRSPGCGFHDNTSNCSFHDDGSRQLQPFHPSLHFRATLASSPFHL